MCFSIVQEKERILNIKTARTPIKVWKMIRKDGRSPYFPLIIDGEIVKWKKGWEYSETRPFRPSQISRWGNKKIGYHFDISGSCFHLHKNKKLATKWMNSQILYRRACKIVEMTIPKGARYIEDNKQIVSNRVIY